MDDVIVIEDNARPFSKRGDWGLAIVNAQGEFMALLLARSEVGTLAIRIRRSSGV